MKNKSFFKNLKNEIVHKTNLSQLVKKHKCPKKLPNIGTLWSNSAFDVGTSKNSFWTLTGLVVIHVKGKSVRRHKYHYRLPNMGTRLSNIALYGAHRLGFLPESQTYPLRRNLSIIRRFKRKSREIYHLRVPNMGIRWTNIALYDAHGLGFLPRSQKFHLRRNVSIIRRFKKKVWKSQKIDYRMNKGVGGFRSCLWSNQLLIIYTYWQKKFFLL